MLDARIDAWTGRAEGAWGKLRAVATQMRTEGTYTDGGTPNSFEKVYLPGHATARLSRFVNSTKLAGNDEQYAATLALVGRRLGIPSRVVMGAEPEASGEVRGRDVHAWVEVQLDDGTWYPLRAGTFVPSRDKTPSEQQLKSEEQKVGAQVPPPAGVNPPSLLQGPDQAQNATDLAKRKKSPFDVGAWPWWLKVLVLGIVLPLLLAAGYLLLVRRLKVRRRLRHASTGPVPARAAWVWRDLVAEARSFGVRVPRRATRREQAEAVDAALAVTVAPGPAAPTGSVAAVPDTAPSRSAGRPTAAAVVAGAVDAVVFGSGDGDPDAVLAVHADAEQVLERLRAGASRWVRWRSDADPRPLLARTERRVVPPRWRRAPRVMQQAR